MEDALHDVLLYREFTELDGATARPPDESTILRFRHLLERHDLAADIFAWATTCCVNVQPTHLDAGSAVVRVR